MNELNEEKGPVSYFRPLRSITLVTFSVSTIPPDPFNYERKISENLGSET